MFTIEELENTDGIFDGRYKLIRPLNTDGATADVWLALDTNTIDDENIVDDSNESREESGMLVAIKIYRPKNALDIEGEQRFRDEFKIAYDCHHTNLLQPTSFSIFKGIPYLVLPYCKLGSSEQLIGKAQDSDEVWKFILDVSSGLARLHSNQPQIIHQDIKPANILIDNSHNFTITDFGISSQTNKSNKGYYDNENSGTLAYMAPERFDESHPPIPASDIWAFGATLCEILTGKVPFGEEGGQKQMEGADMVSLSGIPTSIKKLIQDCLKKDPSKRPTALQIAKAAQVKQYPVKNKLTTIITLALVIIALACGGYYYYAKYIIPKVGPTQTAEEVFNDAYQQLNSNTSETARHGLLIMDSLSRCQYIPAMYEVALTYGWSSDSLLMNRKIVLGIELDENKLLPKKVNDRTKAKDLFDSILELSDTTYAQINAWTAYRMAGYYGDRRLYKTSTGSADISFSIIYDYLNKSEYWALMSKDSQLLEKIEKARTGLREIEEQSNNQ